MIELDANIYAMCMKSLCQYVAGARGCVGAALRVPMTGGGRGGGGSGALDWLIGLYSIPAVQTEI